MVIFIIFLKDLIFSFLIFCYHARLVHCYFPFLQFIFTFFYYVLFSSTVISVSATEFLFCCWLTLGVFRLLDVQLFFLLYIYIYIYIYIYRCVCVCVCVCVYFCLRRLCCAPLVLFYPFLWHLFKITFPIFVISAKVYFYIAELFSSALPFTNFLFSCYGETKKCTSRIMLTTNTNATHISIKWHTIIPWSIAY